MLGRPLCSDCYDYTGHVLFNALAPELWRRFTITVPRQLARLAGLTRKQLRQRVRVRFVKVAEYQARGIIHYHAVIRLDAATEQDYQPPPPGFDPPLLKEAVVQAAAAITLDVAAHLDRLNTRAVGTGPGDTGSLPVIDPDLRRIVRFGTQTDARTITRVHGLPATGTDLPAPAVANYIAKYATKAISTPGLPARPVRSPAAITALRCPAHHKQLITTCWQLGKRPCAAQLALNRWTHMLGYRGHFLTKSRRYSVTFGQLRAWRTDYRRAQNHPGGETDPPGTAPR
jgi:Replication initiator protein, pSAM2